MKRKIKLIEKKNIDPCALCGTQRCLGTEEDIKNCPSWTGVPTKEQEKLNKMFEDMKMKKQEIVLTDKDKIAIYSNIASGPYSKELAYDSLEETLHKIGLKEFSCQNERLTTAQVQILNNVIDTLINKLKHNDNT